MIALWSSPNHIAIQYMGPIKKISHLRPIYLMLTQMFDCYCLSFSFISYNKTWVFIMWEFTLKKNTSRGWVFNYHSNMYTMEEPLYPCNIALVSIWLSMTMTQLITRLYKYFLTLTYPLNTNIWLVLQFWYSWISSLITYRCWLLMPSIHLCTKWTLVKTRFWFPSY